MGEIDKGIKLLTLSTSVRWFGWGLGETFIPVFLLLFSGSFFETGLLTSSYYLIYFLTVPFAGMFADRFSAKKLILFGGIIYVFVGLGYYWAGVSGMILFVILTRGLNGVSASIDQIARESYIIRHSAKKDESKIFGRFDRIANSWWIVGIILGLFLIKYFEIHELLLMIAPTSLIAFFIIGFFLEEKPLRKKRNLENPYLKMLREVRNFNGNLRKLAVLTFFFGAMSTIVYYFAPSVAYAAGNSLVSSSILVLAYALPLIFSERLGKIADKTQYRGYYLSLASLIFVLLVLAFSPNYYLLLISMFFAGATFEFSGLTNRGFLARNCEMDLIGETDAAMAGIAAFGAILGPVIFGWLLGVFSPMHSYFGITGLTLVMFMFVYRVR